MSRKEELRKMVSLLRLQANAASSRTAKQTFQKMADYYQREAEQLQGRRAPDLIDRSNKQRRPTKSAA
jgi:hypothetical protein